MKKGLTLVEVMVATAIFTMTFAVCITLSLSSVKQEKRQRDYMTFESICYDINYYCNAYKIEWANKYFGDDINAPKAHYYDITYKIVSNRDEANYELVYSYNKSNELIVNVNDIKNNRKIIDNLNYGSKRFN